MGEPIKWSKGDDFIFSFGIIEDRMWPKNFDRSNLDLRIIREVKSTGPAVGKAQANDIIQFFKLGDKEEDLETTTMDQQTWLDKLLSLKKDSTKKNPIEITFLRGLKIGPVSNEKMFEFQLAGKKEEAATCMGFVKRDKSATITSVTTGGLAETLGVHAGDVILGFGVEGEDWVDTTRAGKKLWTTKFDEYKKKAIDDVKINGGKFTMKIRDTKNLLRVVERRRLSQLDRLVRELQRASSLE